MSLGRLEVEELGHKDVENLVEVGNGVPVQR
jgi:hypothetical protein